MFKFITGKPLWANILLGIGIFLILGFIFLQSLGWITRHDQTIAVPLVIGKSFDEAKKQLEAQGFDVEIQDTVYSDTAALLSVVKQFPTAESRVKMNRTVYLTINRDAAPDIEMPDLVNMTFRSAIIAIQQHGLKMGDTIYAKVFGKDQVLEQRYKGSSIKPGAKIPQGSAIDLVLAKGLGTEEFDMPDLFGMTLGEAKAALEANSLALGEPRDGDPNAFVYKQSIEHLTLSGKANKVKSGQVIDLWVQAQKPTRQAGTDSTAGY